jgi:nucleoid-associated protein YgaU
MSTDPVQLLIDAGAIPASPFSESSRYRGVALATTTRADGTPLAYVKRRLIPRRREIAIAVQHIVRGGERPDGLAHQHYGNALLYWRIADGNAVIDPFELTDTPGTRVAVPVPSGT